MDIFFAVLVTFSVASFAVHCLSKKYVDTYWIGFKRGQEVTEYYIRRDAERNRRDNKDA